MGLLADLDWDFVGRGFCNGFGIYAAVPVLRALLFRKRVSSRSWRTATAAGVFIGGYRLFSQLTREWRGLSPRAKASCCAMLSAAGGLLVDESYVSSPLVIWWALRALRVVLPEVPLGSVAAMCASTAVLAPAGFMVKDEHAPSYQKFLDMMTLNIDHSPLLRENHGRLVRLPGVHWPSHRVQCDNIHWHKGTTSCTAAVARGVAPKVALISLKLYVPLYVAWMIARRRLDLSHLVSNVARSSTFLTLYTSTIWLTTMWFQATVTPNMTRAHMVATAWLAGLWTLVERKSRRPELATYCATHALNSIWNYTEKMGRTTRFNRPLANAMLVSSTGVLAYHHNQLSDVVSHVWGFDQQK